MMYREGKLPKKENYSAEEGSCVKLFMTFEFLLLAVLDSSLLFASHWAMTRFPYDKISQASYPWHFELAHSLWSCAL